MSTPKIMIGAVDVTEEVAAMYDAIVGSMDWGSDFLDADQIRAILKIGALAGFDLPDPRRNIPGFEAPTYEAATLARATPAERTEALAAYSEKYKAAVEKWRAQFKAEIAAEHGEE